LDGVDELGVLLTDGKKCIWYGSYLSNDDIKELYLGQYINSTSYQVTCGLYMGIQYLFELRKKEHYRLVTPEEVATDYTNFQEDLDRVNLDLKINVLELDASNENVQNFMKNVKFEDQFVENQNKHKNHLAKHHEQQDKIHIELSPDGQEINGLTENNENVIEEKLEKKPKKKHHHHKKKHHHEKMPTEEAKDTTTTTTTTKSTKTTDAKKEKNSSQTSWIRSLSRKRRSPC